jgi:hypothetical protein
MRPDSAQKPERWRGPALALLGYFAAWAVMTYPQVLSWRLLSDLLDPMAKSWQLAWVAHALVHEPLHVLDGNVFYPERLTLAYSDTMLAPSVAASPLSWIGAPPALVFNVVMASGFVLSGLTMFLLVRYLTGRSDAAWVSGLAFAFLPFRFNHYAHLELQLTMWMPLALWALHRSVDRGRWRDGMLTGLCIALQMLTCLYYGGFFLVMLAPIALLLVATAQRPARSLTVLAAGALLTVVLASPVLLAHASARARVGERERSEVLHYSAQASDYLRPDRGNKTYPSLADSHGEAECRLFPGFALMGLAVIGLWPVRSRARVAYLLGVVVAFDASRGLHGTIYPWLWDHVSPFRGFRVPARFGMLTALGLAVLAGWGVARLSQQLRTPRARYLLAGALSLVVLMESRSFPLQLGAVGRRVPLVYRWLATQPPSAVLELPVEDAADFGYMYYSTIHWQPIVNGQSGFFPPWYADLRRMAGEFPTDEAIAFLRGHGVTHVIVHRRLMGANYDALTERLAARSDLRFVRSFGQPLVESDVYRIPR